MAMFKNLSERLSTAFKKISGKASISESNIEETLRDVRVALLEADVALPVVRDFLSHVKERALGHEVRNSLNPGQQFLKIVEDFYILSEFIFFDPLLHIFFIMKTKYEYFHITGSNFTNSFN